MLRICVCVSGGGTNLQAIYDAIKSGVITDTEIVRVISNNPGAYALTRAKENGSEAVIVSRKEYTEPAKFDEALLNEMEHKDDHGGFLEAMDAWENHRYRKRS